MGYQARNSYSRYRELAYEKWEEKASYVDSALRFGHVDHVDQAVHMDIWGRLESGPHMVHMVHIPLF
jgi:hypothetical protein